MRQTSEAAEWKIVNQVQSREERADRPPGIAAGMKHSYKILPLFNEILWKQTKRDGAIIVYKDRLFRTKTCLVRGGGDDSGHPCTFILFI